MPGQFSGLLAERREHIPSFPSQGATLAVSYISCFGQCPVCTTLLGPPPPPPQSAANTAILFPSSVRYILNPGSTPKSLFPLGFLGFTAENYITTAVGHQLWKTPPARFSRPRQPLAAYLRASCHICEKLASFRAIRPRSEEGSSEVDSVPLGGLLQPFNGRDEGGYLSLLALVRPPCWRIRLLARPMYALVGDGRACC